MSIEDSLLHPTNIHGIGPFTAVLFIVGEIAGTGVLALPEALKMTGWAGVFLMLLICAGSTFSGVCLGRSWIILEEQNKELAVEKARNPYSMIGEVAFGVIGKTVATVTLVIQLFGGAIISLLLLAEMGQNLLTPLAPSILSHITYCEWIMIMAVVLMPFSFFGSPVDFWPIAFCAMSSTAVASVLIIIAVFSGNHEEPEVVEHKEYQVTFSTVLLGIGSMNYCFAGAAAMPTIQNDMRDKRKFGVSVVVAYILMIFIYLPVSVVGYHYFGDDVQSNIIRNLVQSPLVKGIEILIAIHVFCSYLILLNPVNLNLENFFGLQHSFNLTRCLSRVFMTFLALVVGLTIPKFGKLLNLVGASAVTFQSLTLPCWFYYRLTRRSISFNVKIVLWSIVLLSILIAISSSASAILDLFDPNAFTYPCFIQNCRQLS